MPLIISDTSFFSVRFKIAEESDPTNFRWGVPLKPMFEGVANIRNSTRKDLAYFSLSRETWFVFNVDSPAKTFNLR